MTPVNPQDAMFLLFENRHTPMHVAGLQLFTPAKSAKGPGSPFLSELIAAWKRHATANAPFNLRPVQNLGRWFWEEDDHFDVDYHLRHLALPYPGRVRELLNMVSRLHATPLDRNRPLWEVYLIEGLNDGRFAIYTKFHHALIDGVTGSRLFASTMSTDPRATKAMLPFWAMKHKHRASNAPAKSKSILQKAMATLASGKEIVPGLAHGMFDLVRGLAGSDAEALPFQAPPSMFNVEISGSRRFVAQSYSLPEFKALGKLAGATVNDVTLAVCAGALRRYLLSHNALPAKPLVAMVPVSLHSEGGEGGNQIAMVTTELATDITDPIERLRRIKKSMTVAKDRLRKMGKTEKMAYSAATLQAPALPLMMTGLGKRAPLCNVTISNVPGAPQTLYLQGARLDEAYPVSIPMDYNALNITVSSYGDSFAFGFIACRRTVPGLQRMIDHTDAALAELRKALGKKKPTTANTPTATAKLKPSSAKVKAAPTKATKIKVAKPKA